MIFKELVKCFVSSIGMLENPADYGTQASRQSLRRFTLCKLTFLLRCLCKIKKCHGLLCKITSVLWINKRDFINKTRSLFILPELGEYFRTDIITSNVYHQHGIEGLSHSSICSPQYQTKCPAQQIIKCLLCRICCLELKRYLQIPGK